MIRWKQEAGGPRPDRVLSLVARARISPLRTAEPEGLAADSDADPGCNISTVTGVGFIVLDLD